MFENLNWWEIAVLALVGLFVIGPERLPKLIADAAKMLRTIRQMARSATTELREELGTDIDFDDLNPKRFVRKHLLSEEDEEALRKPLRDAWRDVEEEIHHVEEVTAAHIGESKVELTKEQPAEPPVADLRKTPYDYEAT